MLSANKKAKPTNHDATLAAFLQHYEKPILEIVVDYLNEKPVESLMYLRLRCLTEDEKKILKVYLDKRYPLDFSQQASLDALSGRELFLLANVYFHSSGQGHDNFIRCMTLAKAKNYSLACIRLADNDLFWNNDDKAKSNAERAKSGGCHEAHALLALIELRHDSDHAAITHLKTGVEIQCPESLMMMAKLYELGRWFDKDLQVSHQYAVQSARQGLPSTLSHLAALYSKPETGLFDPEKAYEYFTLLADKRYGEDMYVHAVISLAGMEENGYYFIKNPGNAAALLRKTLQQVKWCTTTGHEVQSSLKALFERQKKNPAVCFHSLCALQETNTVVRAIESFGDEDLDDFVRLCESEPQAVIKVIMANLPYIPYHQCSIKMNSKNISKLSLGILSRLTGEKRAQIFLGRYANFSNMVNVAKYCREILSADIIKDETLRGNNEGIYSLLCQIYDENKNVMEVICNTLLTVYNILQVPTPHSTSQFSEMQMKIVQESMRRLTPDQINEFIEFCREESLQATQYLLSVTSADFRNALRERVRTAHLSVIRNLRLNGYQQNNLFSGFNLNLLFRIIDLAFGKNIARLFLDKNIDSTHRGSQVTFLA